MARPKKPEDQRAALVVGVRLTPAEKALVDQLLTPAPGGAPSRWPNASGLLRGLLHLEARRRGLEPPDSADVDSSPGGGPDEPGPPGRLTPGLDSAPPLGGGPGSSGGSPPAGPPSPAFGGLPSALGGGVLPAGTLLLVWPPGWPLPVAPGGTLPVAAPPAPSPPAPEAHEFIPQGGPAGPGTVSPSVPMHQPPGIGAAEALPGAPALVGEPPSRPAPGSLPVGEAPGQGSTRQATAPEAIDTPPPLPPMPDPATMLRRFERHLDRLPGMLAKDVAEAAGLKPQDVSTFRQGRRITEEKRLRLWAWMNRPGAGE